MATDTWEAEAPPAPAVRLRYRASTKNAPELERMLARYGSLEWQPEGDDAGSGAADAPDLDAA